MFSILFYTCFVLEVVVDTETQVATIQVEAEGVSSVSAINIILNILITQEANVSNEAQLLVEVYSNTRLQTYSEGVSLQVVNLGVNVVNTTINEQIHLVELSEGVTSVGSNLEDVSLYANLLTIILLSVLGMTITQSDTNSPVLVEVVTDLRHNLHDSCLVVTLLVILEAKATTEINLSVHCGSNSNGCQSHHDLFHNLFTFLN